MKYSKTSQQRCLINRRVLQSFYYALRWCHLESYLPASETSSWCWQSLQSIFEQMQEEDSTCGLCLKYEFTSNRRSILNPHIKTGLLSLLLRSRNASVEITTPISTVGWATRACCGLTFGAAFSSVVCCNRCYFLCSLTMTTALVVTPDHDCY